MKSRNHFPSRKSSARAATGRLNSNSFATSASPVAMSLAAKERTVRSRGLEWTPSARAEEGTQAHARPPPLLDPRDVPPLLCCVVLRLTQGLVELLPVEK